MYGEDYIQMEPERKLMSCWNDCPTTKPPARSLEEFLATIDTGRAVAPNDPAVDAARHVLDSLVGKYPSYSRQHLADVSVQAHQLLQAQGVTISVLQFMREVDQATPVAAMRYEDACATFVTFLTVQRKL
ncbi:MAG: hypothetical protein AB7P69_22920 [Candidatus Binatia bacterium]